MGNSTPYVKAESYTKRYIKCPICKDKAEGFYVDYLIKDAKPGKPYEVGPWRCDTCKESFLLKIYQTGDVEIAQSETHFHYAMIPCFTLLKSPHETNPIYLVLANNEPEDWVAEEKEQQGSSTFTYHYNDGTCPTNWSKNIVQFVFQGDPDPHGVFEFVRVISQEDALAFAKSHPGVFDLTKLEALGSDVESIAEYFEDYFTDLFPESLDNEGTDIDGEVINEETIKLLN